MSGGVYYSSGNNDGDAHADSHLVSSHQLHRISSYKNESRNLCHE